MKTLYFKPTLLFAIFSVAVLSLNAQTLKKDFHKEVNTTSASELIIDNQFGKVTFTDWDQNKIVIDVNIGVTGNDNSKTQKLLDKINIVYKEDGSKIKVKTDIANGGNVDLKTSKTEKQTFKIDYTVKCPRSLNFKIDNQFGDVILSTFSGLVSIDLQFGSLNAIDLSGPETKLDLQFGGATIGTLKNAKIDIQHCDLLKITDGGDLSIDGQFTGIEIGQVSLLKADLNSCKLTVEGLKEIPKLDANMGSTKIENVTSDFKSLTIEQNMGDITIGIDPKAGYKLSADVNMGSIKVPEGMKLIKEKETDLPGVTENKVTGTYGNGSSVVKIHANMGSVKIK